jgi:hypothetical protein
MPCDETNHPFLWDRLSFPYRSTSPAVKRNIQQGHGRGQIAKSGLVAKRTFVIVPRLIAQIGPVPVHGNRGSCLISQKLRTARAHSEYARKNPALTKDALGARPVVLRRSKHSPENPQVKQTGRKITVSEDQVPIRTFDERMSTAHAKQIYRQRARVAEFPFLTLGSKASADCESSDAARHRR